MDYNIRKKLIFVFAFVVVGLVIFAIACQDIGMIETPGFMIFDFEENYHAIYNNTTFELIDTVEYELSKDHPTYTYSGINNKNGAGVVLSFIDLAAPIKYTLVAPNSKGQVQTVISSFPYNASNIAYYLPLNPRAAYELSFELNFDLTDGSEGENSVSPPLAPPNLNYYEASSIEPPKTRKHLEIPDSACGRINIYKIINHRSGL